MTPTQPAPLDDAGAMAVLDRQVAGLESVAENCSPHFLLEMQFNIDQLRAARAHLAARLAELERNIAALAQAHTDARDVWAHWQGRAERAEAELAAVREAAGLNILGMPVVANPKVPDGYAAIIQGGNVVGVIKATEALDAARGEGG